MAKRRSNLDGMAVDAPPAPVRELVLAPRPRRTENQLCREIREAYARVLKRRAEREPGDDDDAGTNKGA